MSPFAYTGANCETLLHVTCLRFYFHDKTWHRNVLLNILEEFSCCVGPPGLVGGALHIHALTLLWSVSKCTW